MVSYSHFPNGTVETINKIVLALLRSLISELKWDLQDWPYLLPNIQHTIQNRRQSRLGGLAPVQVRMGKEPENPLHQLIFHHPIKGLSDKPVATGIIVQHYEDLVLSLTHMHKDVAEHTKQRRALARAYHDVKLPKKCRKLPNFERGEFVLVAMDDQRLKSTSKLRREDG